MWSRAPGGADGGLRDRLGLIGPPVGHIHAHDTYPVLQPKLAAGWDGIQLGECARLGLGGDGTSGDGGGHGGGGPRVFESAAAAGAGARPRLLHTQQEHGLAFAWPPGSSAPKEAVHLRDVGGRDASDAGTTCTSPALEDRVENKPG